MNRKKIIVAGVIALSSFANFLPQTAAQDTSQAKTPPPAQAPVKRDSVQEKLDELTERVGLTQEQRVKLKPLLKEYNQKIRDLNKDKSLSKERRFAKFKEIREWGTKVMWPLLTPEQVQKWKEGGKKRREEEAKKRQEEQANKTPEKSSPEKQ